MNEAKLYRLIYKYAQTEQGKWLNDFKWADIPIILISKLPGEIAGAYGCGYILLLDVDEKIIAPTYLHELRHRWQWHKQKIKYLLGKVFRPLIEKDAYREEEIFREYLNEQND